MNSVNHTQIHIRTTAIQPSFKPQHKEKRGYVVGAPNSKADQKKEASQAAARELARLFGDA